MDPPRCASGSLQYYLFDQIFGAFKFEQEPAPLNVLLRSSKVQVTNATAHALRASNATFAWGGYSSGLTLYAAKQSAVDGYLMIASNAASPVVYTQNKLTFGTIPQAANYYPSALASVAAAVSERKEKLGDVKWGILQEDAVFTKAVCDAVPTLITNNGMTIATTVVTMPRPFDAGEYKKALVQLRDKGVNAIVGCTYTESGMGIIRVLEQMDFSPKALLLTSAVTSPGYTKAISKGW